MNNALRKTVRPKAHAAPRENSMYRAFASVYSRGKYHIFFEHFPFGLYSSHRYVGHVESEDLVFWKNKPVAIYPTKKEDADGAYEGSVLDDDNGLVLYYMGINYTTWDKEDINTYLPGTPIKANLMCCHSSDITGAEFDNVKRKKTILSDEELVKCGFESGSVKDPEAYAIDESTRFVTFLGKDIETGRQALGFVKGVKDENGDYAYEYKGKQVLDKEGIEIRTLRYFQLDDKVLFVMEANSPDYKLERGNVPLFKVSLGEGDIDFENHHASINHDTVVPFDYGFDMKSPKVSYDTRNLPYIVSAMVMNHDIKGEQGMVSLPRRISIDGNGKISQCIHPLISQRMIYKSKEQKIRQTHFPLMITATLKDDSSMNVGSLGIYRTNSVLHVDRRKIMDAEEEGQERVKVATLNVTKPETNLRIFLDQDIVEIEVDEEKVISFITFGDDTEIKTSAVENFGTYTMNPTKV